MGSSNLYISGAFNYLTFQDNSDKLKAAAASQAVPATAVAAFIAKENNNYESISGAEKAADRGLDLYVTAQSVIPGANARLREQYNEVKLYGLDNTVAGRESVERAFLKAAIPVLADVGPANIKLYTAIRLIDKYVADNPSGDPLGLKAYQNDLGRLARDLMRLERPVIAQVAALGIKEAQDFFIAPQAGNSQPRVDAANWALLTPEAKDALMVTYMTVGEFKMQLLYAENTARNGGVYKPQPGVDQAGGEWTVQNAAAIGQAIGANPEYGRNPVAPSFGYQDTAAALAANVTVIDPPGLDTPARNSASYITNGATNSNTVTVGSGGTVSDIWLLQKRAGNVFSDPKDFYAAVLASNPNITNINSVSAGQVIYIPLKQTDGAVIYNFAGGATIKQNEVSGEYNMRVPNTDGTGGFTVYSRTYDGNALGAEGYTVKQTTTNAAGNVVFASTGSQADINAEIRNLIGTSLKVDGNFEVSTTLSDNNVTFSATKDSGGVLRLTGIAEVNGLPPDEGTLAVVNASLVEGQFTPADVINRPGAVLQLVETSDRTNPDGNVNTALTTLTGRTDWWNDSRVASLAGDTVGLIAALRSGKPLPIATAGFSFAANQLNDPVLAEIAGALSGITSLAGLVKALEKGDIGRILIDGGGVARSAVTLYYNSLSQQLINQYGSVVGARFAIDGGDTVATDLIGKLDGSKALLEGLGQAIAVLNIINSIANGDIKGAVIAAIAFIPGWGPVAAVALQVLDMIFSSLFGNDQTFEANGYYIPTAAGGVTTEMRNEGGGAGRTLTGIMNKLLEQTYKQAQQVGDLYDVPRGVIAERLPRVTVREQVMFLWLKDPVTGSESARTFDLEGNYFAPGYIDYIVVAAGGNPWGPNPSNHQTFRGANPQDLTADNQIASSPLFYKNLAQQFSDAVATSGAIAPQWEVDTVALQRATRDRLNAALLAALPDDPVNMNLTAGYDYVGWTPQQIANNDGNSFNSFYYGSQGDARPGNLGYRDANSTQTFNPLVLDLNNDRQMNTVSRYYGGGVLFDVDNDGFAEETEWLGPREGILVLDRNGDGQIDTGADLFNDRGVDNSRRGTNALRQLYANPDAARFYGDNLSARDPVFDKLKVWMDVNGDGVAQASELQGLAALGISEIEAGDQYGNNASFVQNGQRKLIQQAYLQAKDAGVATTMVGDSLLVQREELGEAGNQLLTRAVFDYASDVRTKVGHVRVTADGVLTTTDELLIGQEDTAIVVSVEQLLKNDKSSAGTVTFTGLAGTTVGGTAVYDATKKTVTFKPLTNFNSKVNTLASFSYGVEDAQGRWQQATTFIDVGAVDDEATLTVTQDQRRAGWQDLGMTANADGQSVFQMKLDATANFRVPAIATVGVTTLGFYGLTGTELNDKTLGAIGALNGRLYYAGFTTVGDQGSQTAWQEVWIKNSNTGTITAADVDAISPISISVDKERGRDGRFGRATVADNGNGTASYSYARTSLATFAGGWEPTDFWEQWDGTIRYQPTSAGPDDAFYVRLGQMAGEKVIEDYVKVTVSADLPLGAEQDDGRLMLPALGGTIRQRDNPYGDVVQSGAPIILDLNDNGFRFTAVQDSAAFYDLAGDGVRRATAWTSGKDGILAFDANNDGKISGRAEISFKGYLPGATTDLEGLRAFDTNGDSKFSALDAQWSKFRVWQDKNEDGYQTPDELSTLAQRGIASINLTSNNVVSTGAGVTVHGIGSYTRIDGTQAQLADAEFAYTNETFNSIKKDILTLDSTNTVVATGAGDDTITGSAGDDQINAGTGNDRVRGGAGNDMIFGGAGDDALSGGDGNDILWGGIGQDLLAGDAGNDKLHGGSGDDFISGGDGNDELWGDGGDDRLIGGTGVDTYHFARGDGHDTIEDLGGEVSRIVLGAGLRAQDARVETFANGNGYTLHFSNSDSLTVRNVGSQALAPSSLQVAFADGSTTSFAQLLGAVRPVNRAPVVASPFAPQNVNEDSVWSYTVPAGTFTDPDVGDTLTLSATLANGSALPSWLSFNAATRTFSGTPLNANVGTIAIKVVATDQSNASASSLFDLQIINTNDAPVVAIAPLQQNVNEDSVWSYTVPAGTFTDPDVGDTLTLSATLANGSALPSWLSFNAATRTFSGTPLNANVGTIAIKVVATDQSNASASSLFDLQIINTNDAPVVAIAPAAQSGRVGQLFSYALATSGSAAVFTDVDVGDVLTLSATLADGSALPSWLSFNAAAATFSGTPPANGGVGNYSVKVTATDRAGASASSGFAITVQPPLDTTAPTLVSAVPTDDATAVAVGANLVLTFSEAIKAGSGNLRIVNTANAADSRSIAIGDTSQVTISGSILILNPTADLAAGASYSVQLASGVVLDVAGNAYAGIASSAALNFATMPALPVGPQPPAGALVGTPGKDVLTASSTYKEVWGLGDNDIINGFWDSTRLFGGAGNDTINAVGGAANWLDGGDGDDTLIGAWGNDTLIGGEGNNTIRVTGGAALVTAGSGNDLITGSWGDDVIDAGAGNNTINAAGGNNRVLAGNGNDAITADWGDDRINAGDGVNTVSAGEGKNVLVTGSGVDTIAAVGTNVVISGAGNDKITLGWGNDWVQAGKGDDTIDAGGGNNLFAFNKGDGADTVVNSTWGTDTISLGAGIRYADINLAKSGNDLVLSMGAGDQMTLKNWYSAAANRGVGKLQVLTVGGDYSTTAAGVGGVSTAMTNKSVAVFNFTQLVQAFDTARTTTPAAAAGWAVSSSLAAAQTNATSAATGASYINPWAALQAGTALMSNAPISAINPMASSPAQSVDQLLFAALASTSPTGSNGWTRG